MSEFVICTDSGSDICAAKLAEWDVLLASLSFHFLDSDQPLTNEDMSSAEFYAKMRAGGISKTAAANPEDIRSMLKPELEAGRDVLYIAFSSGLSNTYNQGELAADELREEYPQRRIIVIDSLAASAGQGLMVYLAVRKKAEGASLEETARYVRSILPHLCHWFTVDDLTYLKRGGRISPAAAFIAGMLDIKPVLHVDDEGHLINMTKVRGRRQSIRALAEKYEATALDPRGTYFISHGDCLEDAQLLERLIEKKFGVKALLITDIGAVIGSHSGPGTLALFFLGQQR